MCLLFFGRWVILSVYEEKIKVKRSELRAEEKREEYVSVAEGN